MRHGGNPTHGLTKKDGKTRREYAAWCAMKNRCDNPQNKRFEYYGGRGITVCERWRESFKNFFEDMGERPSKKHSIERDDNDGPYSPNNCSWATKKQQARNRRTSHLVEYDGRRMSLAEACELSGVNYYSAKSRVRAGLLFNIPIRAGYQPDDVRLTKGRGRHG